MDHDFHCPDECVIVSITDNKCHNTRCQLSLLSVEASRRIFNPFLSASYDEKYYTRSRLLHSHVYRTIIKLGSGCKRQVENITLKIHKDISRQTKIASSIMLF